MGGVAMVHGDGGAHSAKQASYEANKFFRPEEGRMDGAGNKTLWKIPDATSDHSISLHELQRAAKTVAATSFMKHAGDPVVNNRPKQHWGATKAALGGLKLLRHEASITQGTERAAGAEFGRDPPDASIHWHHITQDFTEDDKRLFAVTGERARKHANTRWAFTDTMGLKAHQRDMDKRNQRNMEQYGTCHGEMSEDQYQQ